MGAPSFSQLAEERYVSLMTFRRDGNGVSTPMWVAPLDGKLYAVTDGRSVKMKRLKRSDRIRLAVCDSSGRVRGQWIEGRGAKVQDPALEERARLALAQKYGFMFATVSFFSRLSGRIRRRAFIEMTIG